MPTAIPTYRRLSEIVSEKTARPFSRRFGKGQGRRHAVPRNAKRRLRIRPDRILGRERCCNRLLRIPQVRMTEAVGADGMTMRVRRDIMNDIVVTGRADAGGNIVEVQLVAHLPGDDVIRAGSVAAETDRADEFALLVVERQAASEHIDAADLVPD